VTSDKGEFMNFYFATTKPLTFNTCVLKIRTQGYGVYKVLDSIYNYTQNMFCCPRYPTSLKTFDSPSVSAHPLFTDNAELQSNHSTSKLTFTNCCNYSINYLTAFIKTLNSCNQNSL